MKKTGVVEISTVEPHSFGEERKPRAKKSIPPGRGTGEKLFL